MTSALSPLNILLPIYLYIYYEQGLLGFYHFPIILVINRNCFGARIIPDLASGSPLKLEAWILTQLRWTGVVRCAY